jgi:hypothetical protein
MFGLTLFEFLLFLKQLGITLAGGAALWGLVFFWKSRHVPAGQKNIFFGLSEKLIFLFTAGMLIAALAWLGIHSFYPNSIFAHEGINLPPVLGEIYAAFQFTTPIFFSLSLFFLVTLFFYRAKRQIFRRYLGFFYFGAFLGTLAIFSLPAWRGVWDSIQWFYLGHSVHSIMTLGTVAVLDYLFWLTRNSHHTHKYLYPVFPAISKVIWVGLGIDFLSVVLIFNEGLVLAPKFFFMQTVVAILIINGGLLSGPITNKLLSFANNGEKSLEKKWAMWMGISGSISIASWMTITFTDFFWSLTLSYWQMLLLYILWVGLVYVTYRLLEKARV